MNLCTWTAYLAACKEKMTQPRTAVDGPFHILAGLLAPAVPRKPVANSRLARYLSVSLSITILLTSISHSRMDQYKTFSASVADSTDGTPHTGSSHTLRTHAAILDPVQQRANCSSKGSVCDARRSGRSRDCRREQHTCLSAAKRGGEGPTTSPPLAWTFSHCLQIPLWLFYTRPHTTLHACTHLHTFTHT